MGDYLKLFETHTEYNTYITGNDKILPNVSYCEDNNEVHYNPYIPPFFCKLTLNNGNVIELEGSGELTSAMVSDTYKSTLVSVESGELCTSIGDYAFFDCSGLTSVTIGSGATSIGDSVFYGCSNLTSLIIPNTVTSIGAHNFQDCNSLSSINIPDSVTSIDEYAFAYCDGLTSVTIGNGITSIGSYAFQNCSGLTSVTLEATTPPTLGSNPFFANASGRKIYVPAESVDAYKAASRWSSYASAIQPIPTI